MELCILTSQEIEKIHQATVRVLEETGIVLTESGSRELCLTAGCKLDEKHVYIPGELVENCIDLAEKNNFSGARRGENLPRRWKFIFYEWRGVFL